jgi:hypothetical protein
MPKQESKKSSPETEIEAYEKRFSFVRNTLLLGLLNRNKIVLEMKHRFPYCNKRVKIAI